MGLVLDGMPKEHSRLDQDNSVSGRDRWEYSFILLYGRNASHRCGVKVVAVVVRIEWSVESGRKSCQIQQ